MRETESKILAADERGMAGIPKDAANPADAAGMDSPRDTSMPAAPPDASMAGTGDAKGIAGENAAPYTANGSKPTIAETDIPYFTFAAYARDHGASVLAVAACLAGMACMLAVMGLEAAGIFAVTGFVALCLTCVFVGGYARRAHYYHETFACAQQVSHSAHFTPLVEEPRFLDGRIAHATVGQLTRVANREIADEREHAQAYREYVELWVHEAKTSIAAAKLMLEGLHGPQAAKLRGEIERLEAQVEQALYYARSVNVAGDYLIRDVKLAECVRTACKKNASYLIDRGVTPVIEVDEECLVLADGAWCVFSLCQVVVNSAKYGARRIVFSAREEEPNTPRGRTVLEVRDDGPGIPAADVPRVFDHGFTGERGREQGQATGMGLYLVATMCAAMGVGVGLGSEEGAGTRVVFSFPHDRERLGDENVRFA